jgi:hypothetical protein
MRIRTMPRFAAWAALLLLCASVKAQTMYRCGSSYQDRPCDNTASQKVVGTPSVARPQSSGGIDADAAASGATDRHCRERGIQAEKIMWAREGGATLNQQLSDYAHPVNGALATDVYQRRGSAAEVRRAVEQDCGTEAARALEAQRLNAAAAAVMGGQGGRDMDSTPKAADSAQVPASVSQRPASNQASRCSDLQAEAKSIASQQHSGGSLSTMRSLDDRANQNSAARNAAGC